MHSKLQLLKYPNYLRLVIPTGNLVPYDWGETSVMENVCASFTTGDRPSEIAIYWLMGFFDYRWFFSLICLV